MTQGVVNQFKAIEIQKQQRDFMPVSLGTFQCLFQIEIERQAIGQAGERVVMGQLTQAGFGLFNATDIGKDRDVVADVAMFQISPCHCPSCARVCQSFW